MRERSENMDVVLGTRERSGNEDWVLGIRERSVNEEDVLRERGCMPEATRGVTL